MNISSKIAVTLLLCANLGARAQFDYQRTCADTHKEILDFEFDAPKNTAASNFSPWLSGYSAFVRALTNSDNLSPDDFSVLIKELKEHDDDSEFFHLCLCDLYLMRSYAAFINDSRLTAASCYMLALQNMNKTTGWKRNRFSMIQIVLDAQLYNTFPTLAKNITQQQRIEEFCRLQLEIEADPSAPATFKNESALMAILLLPSIGDDGTAVLNIYRNSPFIQKAGNAATALIATRALMHHGQADEAAKTLSESLRKGHFGKCNMFNLLMGNTLLNMLNDSCQIFLNQYVNNQANNAGVGYAKLKLAWHYFLNGDTLKVKQLHNEISLSQPSTPNDRQAFYECTLMPYWDTTLLRARLLFDAGNYTDCEQLLLESRENIKSYSAVQLNDYAYRMGRACHKNGKTDLAKHFYSIAANPNLADIVYYPCYSLYYLGSINQTEGNNEAASSYFKQCLKTNSPIYKESIHRKAEMAANGK